MPAIADSLCTETAVRYTLPHYRPRPCVAAEVCTAATKIREDALAFFRVARVGINEAYGLSRILGRHKTLQ